MIGLNIHNSLSKFRFRRWSRKAWAVFASLKRVISIGNLALQMVPGTIMLERIPAFFSISNDEEDDSDGSELPLDVILQASCQPVIATTVIPGDCLLNNYNINQTVDAAFVVSTVSFFK